MNSGSLKSTSTLSNGINSISGEEVSEAAYSLGVVGLHLLPHADVGGGLPRGVPLRIEDGAVLGVDACLRRDPERSDEIAADQGRSGEMRGGRSLGLAARLQRLKAIGHAQLPPRQRLPARHVVALVVAAAVPVTLKVRHHERARRAAPARQLRADQRPQLPRRPEVDVHGKVVHDVLT